MIKAVIYDMDGLIIDSEPLWQEAEISVFKSLNINLTKENCMKVMGMRTDEEVDSWFRRFPWEGPSKTKFTSETIRVKISPLDCLAIEDSFNGVLAAKAAKMKCIAIPYEGVRHDKRFAIADVTLDSLMQIDSDVWRR